MLDISSEDLYVEDEISDYIEFLNHEEQLNTGFLTHKKVQEHYQELGEALNILMVYPDIFMDIITPKKSHFKAYFFQRLMLRGMARSEQTYYTFARGTSKSFLADFDRYFKCMNTPNHHSTITAGTKQQAAEIAKQKVLEDLWVKFPLLSNEMQKRKLAGKIREAYNTGKDYVEFRFKNNSSLDLGNVRGLRKESLILEEVIEQDATKVNEVYLPLLNKPRTNCFGLINPYEPQSQTIFITTAGYHGTYAYDKLLETLVLSTIYPNKFLVLTGTYRIPMDVGLVTTDTIRKVKSSPSFSKSSFEREYESVWSDAPVGAAFKTSLITTLRKVKKVELENSVNSVTDKSFYVVSADMSKDGAANTAVVVLKVIPKDDFFTYKIVNLFTVDSTDYLQIANTLKKTVRLFNARLLVYDANGVGAGIRDWLNKETTDTDGMKISGLGIINPPTNAEKDVIRYPKDQTLCYEIKAVSSAAEQIHFFFFGRMSTGAITFPIKLSAAYDLLKENKSFLKLSRGKKERYLASYKFMDRMEEELKNLDIINTSDKMNSTLKIIRRNKDIQKDFFSATEYGVYATSQNFETDYYRRSRTGRNRSDMFIFE